MMYDEIECEKKGLENRRFYWRGSKLRHSPKEGTKKKIMTKILQLGCVYG